jgi:hypothetical protein
LISKKSSPLKPLGQNHVWFIWPSGFRGEDLEIDQSETRIACGGHVC